MKKSLSLLIICFFSIIANQSFAQPGSLDLNFNGTGKVITDFRTHVSGSNPSIAKQADGKIVQVGIYKSSVIALVRYNNDGTLDNTFGTLGQVITKISSFPKAIAIQGDGKIIVAGVSSNDFIAIRFNTNGSIDNSFGPSGIFTTDIEGDEDQANAIVIQNDGKIILAGSSYNNTTSFYSFALARVNSNGTLDNTFSGDGKVVINTAVGTADSKAYAVTVQPDGKIVAAGGVYDRFLIVRYNSNGSLDNSFSYDGKQTTIFGDYKRPAAQSVKIQPDGKIVAAGYTDLPDGHFTAVRYNTNGSLDNTFSSDGIADIELRAGAEEYCSSVIIQSDGKLLLAGTSSTGTTETVAMARLNPNGSLDNSFGSDGKVLSSGLYGFDLNIQAILQPDNKIILSGNEVKGFALLKFNADGSIDNSFSSDGKVSTELGIFNDKATAVALKQDGKIVVAGYSLQDSKYKLALARYNVDGTLDKTFNSTGLLAKEFSGNFVATALKIQADGKIVAAGYLVNGTNRDFAVVRLNADGTPDNTFSGDGLATTTFGSDYEYANSLALQADGKIVLAGYVANSAQTTSDFAIARFNHDGSLDNLFSLDGKLTKGFTTNSNQHANAVVIQPDNKILIAGYTTDGTNRDFALLRLTSNGSFDNTFSDDGAVTTDINNQRTDVGASIALQPDGKIVVGGNSYNGTDYDFAVVRYNTDGSLDNTFDVDGKKTSTFDGTSHDYGTTIAVQSDGKIVVGGYSGKNSIYDFALLRLSSNGKSDNSFGNFGKILTDFSGYSDIGNALALQQDGRIVLAGLSNNDFAVARYNSAANQPATLEAELAVLSGAVVASNQPGYTGTGFADFINASSDYIEWTVNTTAAGSFSLKFRYANGGTTNRPLQLQVNGTTVVASLTFSPTGGSAVWSFSSANANLIAGANKVRLTAVGSSGPNIDNLAFNMVVGQSGTLEAEQAVLSGAVVAANQPGFTGTGFADYINASGDFIEWTVNATTAGSFSLKFRYANGGATNRPLQLKVGTTIVASLSFPPTGGSAVWSFSSANANLIAGANKVRLTATGSSGPNVDHLAFSTNPSLQSVQKNIPEKSPLPVSPDFLSAYVAPNPVKDIAKLVLSTSSNLPISIQLVDILGRSYKIIKVSRANSGTINIPVNDVPPGNYIILLKQGNQTTYARMIVEGKYWFKNKINKTNAVR